MPKVLIAPATLAGPHGPHVPILREAGFELTYPPRAEQMVEDCLAAGCTHLGMYSGWRNMIEQNYERAIAFHEIATQVIERRRKTVGSGAEA